MELRPFPESLCHRCAAPPRYVRTARSTFVLCPLLPERYPRQPVQACGQFRPAKVVSERLGATPAACTRVTASPRRPPR